MTTSKDLFDDSTMTFGEHLEVLRVHLIKAIIGLSIAVIGCLFIGDKIVAIIRAPIERALRIHDVNMEDDVANTVSPFSLEWWKQQSGLNVLDQQDPIEVEKARVKPIGDSSELGHTVEVKVLPSELLGVLHEADPKAFPKPQAAEDEKAVAIRMKSTAFSELDRVIDRTSKPVTLNVQEAFMMYMKVAFIAGLIVASPWVLFQLWLFVAAGLYPHERRYVYIYLPISIVLFVGGCVFCFYCVFPFMLSFLLGFNKMLGLQPQIRLSEWISFAVMLPLVFGVSFELPLVMLFMERISIFDVTAYREKRRMAILVISFFSMMLTPSADPMSMILMLIPMLALYEFGIWLCVLQKPKTPFAEEAAA